MQPRFERVIDPPQKSLAAGADLPGTSSRKRTPAWSLVPLPAEVERQWLP